MENIDVTEFKNQEDNATRRWKKKGYKMNRKIVEHNGVPFLVVYCPDVRTFTIIPKLDLNKPEQAYIIHNKARNYVKGIECLMKM